MTGAAAFSITVTASAERCATISGSPVTTRAGGKPYSFTPTGSDPNSDALCYSIANPPVWALFSKTTGQLSGTPSSGQVKTYAGIVITVSDEGSARRCRRSPSSPRGFDGYDQSRAHHHGHAADTANVGTAYSCAPDRFGCGWRCPHLLDRHQAGSGRLQCIDWHAVGYA